MTSNLPAVPTSAGALAVVKEQVQGFVRASVADNTQRAYRAQWQGFLTWCESAGLQACPAAPETVAGYLANLASIGRKVATIDSARATIRKAHEVAGQVDPTSAPLVTQTLKGIRRELGTAPTQKAPVLTADLRAMLATQPADTLPGLRNRALLLLGFAMGARRSELASLTLADIEETVEGLRVTIRRSKTDQEGRGMQKGIVRGSHPDTCPVRALQAWLRAAGITSGPVFRQIRKGGKTISAEPITPQSVALVVKAACQAAKLDPAKYSGHSLRAGLVTQAAKNGVTVGDIMRQTGHRSAETVNRYIRKANLFEDNASAALGL